MYHLLRYQEATGESLRDVGTVVEWGGGFGSLTRLLVRLHAGDATVVLIDTPVFSALQWLYLSATLDADRVVLHAQGPVRPIEGAVNIVPIGLAGHLHVSADLFISNWALNEHPGRAAMSWRGTGSVPAGSCSPCTPATRSPRPC